MVSDIKSSLGYGQYVGAALEAARITEIMGGGKPRPYIFMANLS
ncbi:MAG: hypothetical protein WC412_01955 [Candidatus Omnitrophota bacterium]